MKKLLGSGWLLAGLVWSSALPADEQSEMYSKMVEGLREQKYFDYALLYLDQLSAKTDISPDFRPLIPYEKALVLIDAQKSARLPEEQLKQLDQAQAFLEQFAKESPSHPKAGEANSQRAEILIGKARVEIGQSRSPANQGTRADFQNRARTLIAQARQVFETAQKQHEEAWEAFGKFVNPDEKEKFAAREHALMQLVSAMLNVCLCRYEEAQTYDAGTPEHKKTLNQAAEEFELMHQRYRNYTGGLYARLYEGKCFDDQGDTQKAMGIYNELLEHEGTDKNLRKLQNKTLQFKLEALNRKSPPDSQVVVDLANEWIKNNKAERLNQIGLAIQWEQALAYEALGDQRDASKNDKDRNWRAARTAARQINQFRTVYSDVSLALLQRVNSKLGGKEIKPQDFETAQGLADQHFKAIQELRKHLYPIEARQGKTPEEINKLEQELRTEMHDAAEMYQLALNLADKNDDPKAVAKARLWFAYVHFWARRNYEAAILAEFVAKTAPKDESTLSIDAAYLAMACYVQAYNDTKGSIEYKTADLDLVIKSCEFIIKRWPESDRANDARLMAGRMYALARKPTEAATWFSQVPEADERFPEAQMAAGQAFWDAYRMAARMPQEQRPPAEQLKQWQTLAQQHLRTGIAKLTASLPKEGLPPPELMDAKFSLAAMLINQAQEAEAIVVLTADPQSVIKTITVAEEKDRPAEGVQKRAFAIEVYKLLLRAYVGSGKLDEARETMKTLEKVAAGGDAGADVTSLYVDLGKKLKFELDDYRAVGNSERFASLKIAFETFLNDIYQRKEGHSFGTLSWIGETYAALGESDAANAAAAMDYFNKASTALEEVLKLSEADPNFATTDQLLAAKTRLIHTMRMKKDYPAAEKMASELLKQRKDDLMLQIETAKVYQDWALESGEEKKFLQALSGNPENQAAGFGPLSKRLHGLLKGANREKFFPIYLDMRYQTSLTRFQMAAVKKSPQDKRKTLDNADLEILAFARATKDVPDDVRANFNNLFRQIREAMNDTKRPVKDLEWTADLPIDPKSETAGDEKKEKPKEEPKLPPAPPQESDWVMYSALGVGGLIGLGIIGFMFLGKKKQKKPLIKSQVSESMNFDFGEVAAPSKEKSFAAITAPREKKASAGTATAKKSSSSAAPTATKAPAKPKPKPRPDA